MSNDSFAFKQFTIKQDKCAMKVGTDAVLLGAWINAEECKNILDIGTGTGIIALMLAQKSSADIIAIDIDKQSTDQAIENISNSNFRNIEVIHISLQALAQSSDKKFNLIATNPPYFIASLKSNDSNRTIARHADLLPFEDLIASVKKLLDEKGKFCLILPKNEAAIFRDMATQKGLYLSKLLRVRTRSDKDSEKRHLMQFEFKETEYSESTLVIESDRNMKYSEEYRELTKDYYLNF